MDDFRLDARESVGALVRETYFAIRNAFHKHLRAHQLTSAQWVFLRTLWEHEGINQKELSRLVHTHPTTAVSALSVLERNGYVRRERSEVDRREVRVLLTKQGRQLQRELIPFARTINETLLEGLTAAEQAQLKLLLRRIVTNINR